MGTALFALSDLFINLPRADPVSRLTVKPCLSRPHPIWATRTNNCSTPTLQGSPPAKGIPHLRVLRLEDTHSQADCAGRMVISGRMADVCAELDRLVALEAQRHPN